MAVANIVTDPVTEGVLRGMMTTALIPRGYILRPAIDDEIIQIGQILSVPAAAAPIT